MENMSKAIEGYAHSRLREIEIDLLFWYPVQNLFHGYFNSLGLDKTPSEHVLTALNQIVSTATQTEYFSLTDVSNGASNSVFNFCSA